MTMKKSSIKFLFAGLSIVGLFSCEKEFTPTTTENNQLSGKAAIKFVNYTVNSSRNYLFIDDILVSGTASAFTNVYPSGAVSFITIPSTSSRFLVRDTLPTTTQVPITLTSTLEPGSYYTLFTYDSLSNAKARLVKDAIEIPADTTARVRFANFAYSTASMPNIDIFSTRRGSNVATNLKVADVTGFIPYASNLLDTLHIRETGRTTNLVSLNGFSPITKRSYTVVFRGSWRLAAGTTLGRGISSFLTY